MSKKEKSGIIITYVCFALLIAYILYIGIHFGHTDMIGGRATKTPELYVDGTDMTPLLELGSIFIDIVEKILRIVLYVVLLFWYSILSFGISLLLRVIFNYKDPNAYRPKMPIHILVGVCVGVALLISVFSREPTFVIYIANFVVITPIPLFYWLNIINYKKPANKYPVSRDKVRN